jgi:hypothetical protein
LSFQELSREYEENDAHAETTEDLLLLWTVDYTFSLLELNNLSKIDISIIRVL